MATYTLEQVREARRRALAAGDTEAAEKLGRYAVQLAIQQAPSDEFDATSGMSTLDKLRAGIGQGMTNVARHIGNLVGLVGDEELQDAKALDADLLNTGAGRVGSIIGEASTIAVPMGGATAGLARAGAIGARLVGGAIRRGATEGAVQGALMADPGEGVQGALQGALFGSALPAAGAVASRVARGVDITPQAQRLLDEGIELTPGQMNPRGVMNRMEQALEGTFGIGDVIQNARENAMRQFNRRFVERGMAPGAKLSSRSDDFNALVDEAARSFDTAYDAAKGFPVGAKIMTERGEDIPLSKAFALLAKKPRLGLTERARIDVNEQLQGTLSEMIRAARASGRGLTSDDLIAFRSMIRQGIRDEAGDTVESRARQALLKEAEQRVTDAIESQLPDEAVQALRAADRQFAEFAIVREAAKKAKDRPNGPTPFQVSQAIAEATNPNQYARGGGLGRELSKAAMETFQSNVPRTGLSGVGRLGALVAGTAAQPQIALPVLIGTGALIGTKTGRRIAAGRTRPQRLAQALRERVAQLPGREQQLLSRERLARALLTAAAMGGT